MKKILIEFFDYENLNNCISQLHDKFDKIHYLYFADDRSDKREFLFGALEKFNRGTYTGFHKIEKRDIEEIISKLTDLVKDENSYVFDITGGSELFIAAAGIFIGKNPDLNITLRQYNVRSGKLSASYPGAFAGQQKNYRIGAETLIKLQGCAIEYGEYEYDLQKGDLEKCILKLWNVVKNDPVSWNKFCTLPNFSSKSFYSGATFYKRTMSDFEKEAYQKVIKLLKKSNIISVTESKEIDGDTYSGFKSNLPPEADILFEKGGNILELLTYAAIKRVDENADVMVGVPVDWDGEFTGNEGETKNEIDLIVSNGRLPVFISCKNTSVSNDFLYELKSVARHYGGRYAKSVLVSTASNAIGVHRRAESMNIVLIDSVSAKSINELGTEIAKACFGE